MSDASSPRGIFSYAGTNGYFVGVMPLLLTNGGSSLSDDWKTATLNTPQAIEAATFMRSMVEKKWSPEPGSGTYDAGAQMAQGKLAMFGGGRWPVIGMRNLEVHRQDRRSCPGRRKPASARRSDGTPTRS